MCGLSDQPIFAVSAKLKSTLLCIVQFFTHKEMSCLVMARTTGEEHEPDHAPRPAFWLQMVGDGFIASEYDRDRPQRRHFLKQQA